MKNSLLAVLLSFSMLSASAMAATNSATTAEDFKIGPIVGVSFANDTFDVSGLSLSLDSRTGFAGGVSGELRLGEWLFFQPELMYIQKGFVIPAALNTSGTGDATFAANYLEIPLLMKAKLITNVVNPYFLFGPSPSFKLSSSAKTSAGTSSVDNVHTFDFGLHFGVGAEAVVAQNITAFLDGRYILGLTNIDGAPEDQNSNLSVRNRTWMILTGARFALF
jgi:hypothetical protein